MSASNINWSGLGPYRYDTPSQAIAFRYFLYAQGNMLDIAITIGITVIAASFSLVIF
jgi:hypothetical protein